MSEKKAREKIEESFEVGRYLGVIARRDPELYERIRAYAETEGRKLTEIVYDALTLYDEYVQLSAVDTRSLLVALRLLDHLFKRLLQMMMTLNQYFTSEFFQQQIDMMYNLQQRKKQEQVEIKKSKEQEVKSKLIEMTMTTVMTMMQGLMSSLMKLQLPQGQQATTVSMPTSDSGVKIVKSAKK